MFGLVLLRAIKKGWAYDFKLTFGNGKITQTDDPYSKAVTVNGVRSVIEDYNNIKPTDFNRMLHSLSQLMQSFMKLQFVTLAVILTQELKIKVSS